MGYIFVDLRPLERDCIAAFRLKLVIPLSTHYCTIILKLQRKVTRSVNFIGIAGIYWCIMTAV